MDIIESIPFDIGSSVLSDYPPDAGWDVTFGQLGFTLRPTPQSAYQRGTEDSRKQQIDTSESPGEQSLSAWWVRSQDSWDMGAGVTWYEPGDRDHETVNRFGSSHGIDPWTIGEVRLLHKADELSLTERSATNYVCGLEVGGNLGYIEAYGNHVSWSPIVPGAAITGVLPGGNATQPAASGGMAWIGHTNGVSRFIPGGAGVTTPITCSGIARVWWVKARLIVAVGPMLYEVPATATGALGTGAGVAIYEHPNTSWIWSDVSETAGALLASGYAGGDSAIFRWTLEQDESGVPILSGASQVGRTPPGERIHCMSVYLGTALVLGTSSGVRVGRASDTGDVQYGPLTVETTSAVLDVTFRDRFAYLTVSTAQDEDQSGAVRVDLSAQINDTGRYAWAFDMPVPETDTATSLALVGERVVLCAGNRLFVQSATEYVDQGRMDTGRIRFGTVEPKAFRLLRCVTATNGGEVGLTVVAPDGSEHRVVEFTDSFRTEENVPVQIPLRPVNQYVSIVVRMSPSATNATPVLSALSLKAAPAATKIRLFQFPISCFDIETDRHGNTYGTKGGAYLRLAALESLEETGRPVTVSDRRTGETFTGQIDSVDFSGSTPPSRGEDNFGGTVTVRVRRL